MTRAEGIKPSWRIKRELVDDLVVALQGGGQGQVGVDLQRLPLLVAAVGLDMRVVDALGLQPGQQEVPEPMWADRVGDPRRVAYRASILRTPRVL